MAAHLSNALLSKCNQILTSIFSRRVGANKTNSQLILDLDEQVSTNIWTYCVSLTTSEQLLVTCTVLKALPAFKCWFKSKLLSFRQSVVNDIIQKLFLIWVKRRHHKWTAVRFLVSCVYFSLAFLNRIFTWLLLGSSALFVRVISLLVEVKNREISRRWHRYSLKIHFG